MDDKELEQDFDYELYAIKYGIDLRSELEEGEGPKERSPEDSAEKPEKAAAVKGKTAKEADQGRMELYDWLQCIVSAILCGILIFVFVGRIIGVVGYSMLDTLRDNDKVIMSNLFYTPKYGDIVVLKTDVYEETPLVKRVIATAGQTIDIDFVTGEVRIDDRVIVEEYIREKTLSRLDFEGPITVPEGFVFVMGDNRNESTDSRSRMVGLVDTRQILGKVLFVLIPGQNADGTRSWNRIGSVYR